MLKEATTLKILKATSNFDNFFNENQTKIYKEKNSTAYRCSHY